MRFFQVGAAYGSIQWGMDPPESQFSWSASNGPKLVGRESFFFKKNVSLLKGVQYLLKHGSLTMYVVAQHGGETDHEF